MREDKKLLSLSSKFPESGGDKQVCQESKHLDFNDGQFNWGGGGQRERERERVILEKLIQMIRNLNWQLIM